MHLHNRSSCNAEKHGHVVLPWKAQSIIFVNYAQPCTHACCKVINFMQYCISIIAAPTTTEPSQASSGGIREIILWLLNFTALDCSRVWPVIILGVWPVIILLVCVPIGDTMKFSIPLGVLAASVSVVAVVVTLVVVIKCVMRKRKRGIL